MERPTPEQLALLGTTERMCFEIADTVHRSPGIQRMMQPFLRTVGSGWVTITTSNLRRVKGIEHVQGIAPDRGVMFVSNHRSFFDFYVTMAVIYRHTSWVKRIFFPVRSNFFYEGPLGVFVNAVMSGWAMFPPVMRAEHQRPFNRYTTDFIVEALGVPGTVVGYHPEGTRGKGDNPYELLPAQSGVGAIVQRAKPIVMPVFTLGLINNFPKQISSNFNGTGAPVTLVFGPPLDLSRFDGAPDTPETARAIADYIRAVLVALGEEERAFRASEGLPPLGPQR